MHPKQLTSFSAVFVTLSSSLVSELSPWGLLASLESHQTEECLWLRRKKYRAFDLSFPKKVGDIVRRRGRLSVLWAFHRCLSSQLYARERLSGEYPPIQLLPKPSGPQSS